MQRLIVSCLFALVLALTACASFIDGAQEEVTLTTPGAPGSRCILRNDYFEYIINPPRQFFIERTSKPYKIVCLASGNRVKTAILSPGFNRLTMYNVSNGVVPGVATDLATGALFSYPDQIVMDFTGMKPEPMPLPAYQQELSANPLIKGMEEFRPDVPALQSDEDTEVTPMQKRPENSDGDAFGMLSLTPDEAVNAANGASRSDSSGSASSSGVGTPGAPTVTGGPSTAFGKFKTSGAGGPSASPAAATSAAANGKGTSSAFGTESMVHRQTWTVGATPSATSSPTNLSP